MIHLALYLPSMLMLSALILHAWSVIIASDLMRGILNGVARQRMRVGVLKRYSGMLGVHTLLGEGAGGLWWTNRTRKRMQNVTWFARLNGEGFGEGYVFRGAQARHIPQWYSQRKSEKLPDE